MMSQIDLTKLERDWVEAMAFAALALGEASALFLVRGMFRGRRKLGEERAGSCSISLRRECTAVRICWAVAELFLQVPDDALLGWPVGQAQVKGFSSGM
jgi:hypothetical protein